MRILGLALLFISVFYFFSSEEVPAVKSDALGVKVSAPARAIVKEVSSLESQSSPEVEISMKELPEDEGQSVDDSKTTDDSQEVAHLDDRPDSTSAFEKRWQQHLKDKLEGLEPEIGTEMFNSYIKERDSYQAELEDLIEKHQQSPDLEQMIEELEGKFEDKVKDIYGPHYEELKEDQGNFMNQDTSAGISRGPAVSIATR